MKALILIAHGSRADAANREFQQWVENISQQPLPYSIFQHAFLEMTTPTLQQAADAVVAEGATSIDVYPVFFNNGKHVGKDIPALVSAVMDNHPQLDIQLLDYFGANTNLAAIMARHILEQHG